MTRWALPDGLQGCRQADFVLRRWGEEGVVYDDATGAVQVWNGVACDVFELLLTRSPLSESQIAAALLPGEDLTEEDFTMVRQLLLQFQSMGVAECLPD